MTDVDAALRRTDHPVAVLAHPSAELYGADRQLLESVSALVDGGWTVHVVLPGSGPLEPEVVARGGVVHRLETPVLRRGLLSVRGLASLSVTSVAAVPRMVRLLREIAPDVLYVNTIVLPVWSFVGRVLRLPIICHVHEAEQDAPRAVLLALTLPLLLPTRLIANSDSTREVLESTVGALRRRITVVHNGVPGPPVDPSAPPPGNGTGSPMVLLVGRLSWRKGSDVALEAVAQLRRTGRDVRLELCGATFAGNEAFEAALHTRSLQPDLAGAVSFAGYTSPVWPALERASVVIVPSTTESFGNAAVEAQLACRPVIASDVQALRETIRSGHSGLLVPPRDATALAEAIASVLDDDDLARSLADAGRSSALARFTPERYRKALLATVAALPVRRPPLGSGRRELTPA